MQQQLMKGAVMNLRRARGYVGGLKQGKGKSCNFIIISEDARIIKISYYYGCCCYWTLHLIN